MKISFFIIIYFSRNWFISSGKKTYIDGSQTKLIIFLNQLLNKFRIEMK